MCYVKINVPTSIQMSNIAAHLRLLCLTPLGFVHADLCNQLNIT